MSLISFTKNLFIPRKDKGSPDYGTDMRAIERWCNSIPITELVAGSNITLTPSNGQGSTVEISASGGGGGGYASLTGPGTGNPTGALTQGGPFTINNNLTVNGIAGTARITLASGGAYITGGGANIGLNGNVQITNGSISNDGTGDINFTVLDFANTIASPGSPAYTAQLTVNGAAVYTSGMDRGSIAFRASGGSSTPLTQEFFFISASVSPPTPGVLNPSTFAWAFSTNGHIYFWNTTGWSLVI